MLKVWSMMELAVQISILDVSRISKTSSIVKWNVVESWCICGNITNFIYYSSMVVI